MSMETEEPTATAGRVYGFQNVTLNVQNISFHIQDIFELQNQSKAIALIVKRCKEFDVKFLESQTKERLLNFGKKSFFPVLPGRLHVGVSC